MSNKSIKLTLPTKKISISELKTNRKEILSRIEAPVFDIPENSSAKISTDSSAKSSTDSHVSAKELLQTEWEKYCASNNIIASSKSRFKRWKLENQASKLAEGRSPEWGDIVLKASAVTNKILNDSLLFKQQPLSNGPLGVKNEGENKLGQGFEQTAVHFAITKVPGAVIAQQIIRDSGKTDFITVETWKTAREQMNPTSVAKQGDGTIGNYELLTEKNIIDSYKSFITSTDNTKYFGCPVAPTLFGQQIQKFSCNGSKCIYNYNTNNQVFQFDNKILGYGAGTGIGVPNSEIENNIIKEISCMTCWLCNLPLVKQSPMKKGKPHGNPEPPHTEHVLNILDALFYLDLFETTDTQLMIDYNCYLEQHYYGESNSKSNNTSTGNWGVAPEKEGFLAYINTMYKTQFTPQEPLTIYPGISSLNEAWLKIHDFKFEYLYAHPDCNYEKNDDSLLCIDKDKKNLVFNEEMANNLADRIWKKRLILQGGLLDVLGLDSFKTNPNKVQWKNNVLESWRQRLIPTAYYINFKRGVERGNESFYGFATLCAYICRLPNTIKDVMTNHKSIDFEEKLSLDEKEIPLVPTSEMLVTIIQILSYQIGNLAFKNKVSLSEFIKFCSLKKISEIAIINASKNPNVPSGRMTRTSKIQDENENKKQLQIVAFNKLFENIDSISMIFINIFSNLFYPLSQSHDIKNTRNIIISLVIAKIYIKFIDIFDKLVNEYENEYENDAFIKELKKYLLIEKTVKNVKIDELLKGLSISLSINLDNLNNTTYENSNEYIDKYKEELSVMQNIYKEENTINPVTDVITFDFEESTIPEEINNESQKKFDELIENIQNNESVFGEITKVLKELQNEDDFIITDDGESLNEKAALLNDNPLLLEGTDKDTLVIIESGNDENENKKIIFSIMNKKNDNKTNISGNESRAISTEEFYHNDDFKNKNFSLIQYIEKGTKSEVLTGDEISKRLLMSKIDKKFEYYKNIKNIKIIPNSTIKQNIPGGRKTKRRTRRHKKTRKHNKKRVSRKYIR
jgi:hypothetical protein